MEAGFRTWKIELHAIASTTLTDRQVEREDGVIYLDGTDIAAADAIDRFTLNPTLGHDAGAFAAARTIVASFIKRVL